MTPSPTQMTVPNHFEYCIMLQIIMLFTFSLFPIRMKHYKSLAELIIYILNR